MVEALADWLAGQGVPETAAGYTGLIGVGLGIVILTNATAKQKSAPTEIGS